MNRKALSLVMAGLLSASAVFPAFATSGGAVPTANGTEVWAGVTLWDEDAKIKVEVPTLFAFVVNGIVSTDPGDATAISTTDGSLLLPNVKVKVDTPSTLSTSGTYSIQTVGDGVMQFTNYSTKALDGVVSGRTGLEVTINGNIKNEGDAYSRNYWEHTVSAAATADADGFKKYNINIDGNDFDTPANGGLEMATAIDLDAPINIENNLNLNTTTGLANSGVTKTVEFGVTVGGTRNMYTQVEQSAKVGTIVWTVSAEVDAQADVVTAPDEPYLETP